MIPKQSQKPQKKAPPPHLIKETWTQEFCCVAYPWSQCTPSLAQLDLLKKAGLAKKKICFTSKLANHEQVCGKLEQEFPQLRECGSYNSFKSKGGGTSRALEKLPLNWYNIRDLRNCVQRTSCVYIRPIQRALDVAEKLPVSEFVCYTYIFVL